jgi:hypothetical protein
MCFAVFFAGLAVWREIHLFCCFVHIHGTGAETGLRFLPVSVRHFQRLQR